MAVIMRMVVMIVIMVVAVVMTMMVIVVVVMIVVVVLMAMVQMAVIFALDRLQQLFPRHLAVRGRRLSHYIVNDLVLENRATKFCERSWILLVVLVDHALLARKAASLLEKSIAQLILRDLDLALGADLADD
jgi:predicted ABC-type exoprotein transport system permease subunit